MKQLNLNILLIPVAVACLAVAAQLIIKLPDDVSVAPITGQSMAILMIAELMDWRKGTISVLIYLLLGGLGLPFFADFESGWDVLLGSSLGYFVGFLIAVGVIGAWSEKASHKVLPTAGRAFIATLIILLSGWIGLLRFLDPIDAFNKGIFPFLPGALIKWFLAVILIALARRFSKLMGDLKNENI